MQQDTASESAKQPGIQGFVGDYLLYLLAAASEAASSQFHAHVRKAGIRVPEWRVLACLHDRDGTMITELARIALAEQSRLTKIIVQMEERGLVRRCNDPDDGRRVRVWLTEDGRNLACQLVKDARQHETQLLEGLRSLESAALKPTLQAFLAALEDQALFSK